MVGFKVLHRQLMKELFGLFLVCLAVLQGLIVLGRMVLRLGEILVSLELGLWDILQLIGYLTPFFLLLLLPVACMISMFLTFQRMSSDRELLALRSSGVSLLQVMSAPIVFLLIVTGINVYVSLFGVSWGMDNFQRTMLHLAENRAQVSMQAGAFNRDFPGLSIYAQDVREQGEHMENVFVQDSLQGGEALYILAPKGRIYSDTSRGKVFFTLQEGRLYNPANGATDILDFEEYTVSLDLGQMLGDVEFDRDDPEHLSWAQISRLSAQEDLAEERGEDFVRELAIERQKRMALPVACLVLGFFAIPLGWLCESLKRYMSILILLGMFLFYYSLFMAGISLAEMGRLDPIAALWTPNALFFILSVLLLIKATRERIWRRFK